MKGFSKLLSGLNEDSVTITGVGWIRLNRSIETEEGGRARIISGRAQSFVCI